MLAFLIFSSLILGESGEAMALRPIELNETRQFKDEATRLDCIVVPSSVKDLDSLLSRKPDWSPCTQAIPNFAYTTEAVWLRLPLTLKPRVGEPWYLEIGWPHLDRDLYPKPHWALSKHQARSAGATCPTHYRSSPPNCLSQAWTGVSAAGLHPNRVGQPHPTANHDSTTK